MANGRRTTDVPEARTRRPLRELVADAGIELDPGLSGTERAAAACEHLRAAELLESLLG